MDEKDLASYLLSVLTLKAGGEIKLSKAELNVLTGRVVEFTIDQDDDNITLTAKDAPFLGPALRSTDYLN